MSHSPQDLSSDALAIWKAAVDEARPEALVLQALNEPSLREVLSRAHRILVVGGGKAGAAMSLATEKALSDSLDKLTGWVNVPAGAVQPSQRIVLHAARPDHSNHPTLEGVLGSRRILELMQTAGPNDVALCLLSGGGSALLPAPVEGVTLADKQAITKFLHACGASINEMNCVRKHLSDLKGGRLAQAFRGQALYSLIISDVVGDPLDVIASGPTAPDPTTFADALSVLRRYVLLDKAPPSVLAHLRAGDAGERSETLNALPPWVHNQILGNNARSLRAAQTLAEKYGYTVVNLGSYLEGDTTALAQVFAGLVRSVRHERVPGKPPLCILSGGETTVTLPANPGRGGRNQEFVLALAHQLGIDGIQNTVILSGGTDGEDGPTDAAGALADSEMLRRAELHGLNAAEALAQHDSYTFFEALGSLLKTGLTGTNVMDVRVILLG